MESKNPKAKVRFGEQAGLANGLVVRHGGFNIAFELRWLLQNGDRFTRNISDAGRHRAQ